MSGVDSTPVPTTASEPCNRDETKETPAAQSDNTINPMDVAATASEPRSREEANQTYAQFGTMNKLDLADYTITFQNLDLDDPATFQNCLLDCHYQVTATVSIWRHSIQPIVEHIEHLAIRGRDKLRARESQFGPDWDQPDPEQELLHREAVTFHNLLQKLLDIYSFGHVQANQFRNLWLKISGEARAARMAGDIAPVHREAWKCLLWFWWGFRVYCKSLVDEFRPILEDWDTWNWPNLQAKKEGLRLVAFLVERRVRNLPTGKVLPAREWLDFLVQEDKDAFNWLEDTD